MVMHPHDQKIDLGLLSSAFIVQSHAYSIVKQQTIVIQENVSTNLLSIFNKVCPGTFRILSLVNLLLLNII